MNLTNLPPAEEIVIEGINGRSIQFREPVKRVIKAPDVVITSSPTKQALDPANAVINAGLVQINKISPYLCDLPDTAMAELLVSPKSIATIAGRGLGHYHGLRPFNEDIASIRNISVSHGIHYNAQPMTGMQIYDRPENAPDMTYEQAWANEVRRAFHSAAIDKQNKVIPLAAPTLEIMCGHAAGSDILTLENNLYSRTGEINAAIAKQHGERIPTSKSSNIQAWDHYTCTENPKDQDEVHYFNVGYLRYDYSKSGIGTQRKNWHRGSTRPVALRVLAPDPDFEQLVA